MTYLCVDVDVCQWKGSVEMVAELSLCRCRCLSMKRFCRDGR